MGLVCDERLNAVINTLRQVFRWRSTKWWQSTQASGMKKRPVQPHKVETQVGGVTIEGASGTNWLRSRPVRKTGREKINHLKTFALDCVKLWTVHRKEKEKMKKWTLKHQASWARGHKSSTREEGPTVQLCEDSEVAEKWIDGHYSLGLMHGGKFGQIQKHCTHGGKGRSQIPSRRLATTSSTFSRNTIGKLITWPTWEQKCIEELVLTEVAQGFWDGSSEHNGKNHSTS